MLGKGKHEIQEPASPQGQSVNDGIFKELCFLQYMLVDDVAERRWR